MIALKIHPDTHSEAKKTTLGCVAQNKIAGLFEAISVVKLYFNCSTINPNIQGLEVMTAKTVTISSLSQEKRSPFNAIDDDEKTYIETMEVDDPLFQPFPTLNITYE